MLIDETMHNHEIHTVMDAGNGIVAVKSLDTKPTTWRSVQGILHFEEDW